MGALMFPLDLVTAQFRLTGPGMDTWAALKDACEQANILANVGTFEFPHYNRPRLGQFTWRNHVGGGWSVKIVATTPTAMAKALLDTIWAMEELQAKHVITQIQWHRSEVLEEIAAEHMAGG